MTNLPVLRNPPGGCCPRPAGIKQVHDYCRTLNRPAIDSSTEEVLQDEAGFAVKDETTNNFIYDTLKHGGVFNG